MVLKVRLCERLDTEAEVQRVSILRSLDAPLLYLRSVDVVLCVSLEKCLL